MVASLSEALLLSDEPRVVTTGQPPYTIVHTNKAWANLTGFKFTEVVNRTNSFLKGPATEDAAMSELKDNLSAQQRVKVRVVNYDRQGLPFYNTLECFPLRDAIGVVTHYCGVLQREPIEEGTIPKIEGGEHRLAPLANPPTPPDVPGCCSLEALEPDAAEPSAPEEGAAKRQRREQHMRLADALNNTKDAVVMTQAHHPYAITHVNQPWCEMCGYTLEEVEGLSNKMLQGAETDQALLDDLMASVRRGEPTSTTLINYKKGGERFVNQVKVLPVYNENEEVEQFMAMLTEVDAAPPVDAMPSV